MNNLKAKIHDECLEHESDIWDYVEMLGDQWEADNLKNI